MFFVSDNPGEKRHSGLSSSELKIAQRILLELYCQYDHSLPFRELEPATNTTYYEIVCNPISLELIKIKLDFANPDHYTDISSFITDVRLLFKNVYLYYQVSFFFQFFFNFI